jgi:hypothetical protein
MEMGFGSIGIDQLAEMRARRLLLNEYPVRETNDLNEVTKDLFIGGQGTMIRIQGSTFPALYQNFGIDPTKFLQIAWIEAATLLVMSNCVTEVIELKLRLVLDALEISFRGRRRRQYVNNDPYEITIRGVCKLASNKVTAPNSANMDNLGARLRGLSSKISLVRATPEVARRASELVDSLDALLAGLPPR